MNRSVNEGLNAFTSKSKSMGGREDVSNRRSLRKFLIALVAMALFSAGWLRASASDFDLRLRDDATGDNLFVNLVTGDYLFFNGKRHSFFSGQGKLTVNSCVVELRDSGRNSKRPDRSVHLRYSLCDNAASAVCEVFATGEAYSIDDKDAADNQHTLFKDEADSSELEENAPIRFDGFCLEDDSNGCTLRINGGDYVFRDTRKGITIEGAEHGRLTINGCKVKLTDVGDPKRPDRRVSVEINTCTRKASALVWFMSTGRTNTMSDSNISDSSCNN